VDETLAIPAGAAALDAADADPEAGARPTALLPMTQLARISAYWLGLTAIDAAVGLFIGFQLAFTDIRGPFPLGTATLLLTVGPACIAILIQPTVGSISDYTVTRWGRRKPYIVFGSLLDVVFLYGVATSNTLLMLGTFVVLLTFSTNIARGPFQGYVPDLVAEPQVGLASAMVGMMQIIGNITGYALISLGAVIENRSLALLAVAIVELVTMLSVVLRVRQGLPPKPRRGRSWWRIAAETWGTDILGERSYVWLVASRLFFLTAGGILFAYVAAYFKYTFGLQESEAGAVNLALLVVVAVSCVVSVVPASRLSDRIGRKPVIWIACALGAGGVLVISLSPSIWLSVAAASLFGAAYSIFLSVDWALLTDLIPRASAGRYMGISNVATGSAPLFAAAIGGIVLDVVSSAIDPTTGPRAAFMVGVALYGVSAMLLWPVVEPGRDRIVEPTGATA
jgi:MFS family permease